jgi:hypothetical protein
MNPAAYDESEPVTDTQDAGAEAVADPEVLAAHEEAERKAAEAEKKRVAELLDSVKVPKFLERRYQLFGEHREYVNEIAMALDEGDAGIVGTNYIFRAQHVFLANLATQDPQAAFTPAEMVGMVPPGLDLYGKTMSLLTNKVAKKAGIRGVVYGAAQDASTHGWAIVKLNQQEDFNLDPLGCRRNNDQLDNIARCKMYQRRVQDGRLKEGTAEWDAYKDCEKIVAGYLQSQLEAELQANPMQGQPMVDPMTGMPLVDPVTGEPMVGPPPPDERLQRLAMLQQGQLPPEMDVQEVARYIGVSYEPIQPEDFRFDWTVTRPEDFYQARWMAHRVYMSKDDIEAKFELGADEIKAIKLYDGEGSHKPDARWGSIRTDNPTNRDQLERDEVACRAAVWEIWHRDTAMVYTCIEGVDRFVSRMAPLATWEKWFPFFMIGYNRATGLTIPVSDVQLSMALQDEINTLRAHEREARKSCYPMTIIKRGSMSAEEKAKAEDHYPYAVIEVDEPDELRKALQQTTPTALDRGLYDTGAPRMEMEQMLGISRNAMGTPQGDLATTAAIANEQQGIQTSSRQFAVDTFIHQLLTATAQILNQIMPEENVKKWVGDAALWPAIDREQMFQYLKLDVVAGGAGKPDAKSRMQLFENFAGIASQLGLLPYLKGREVLAELMRLMDIHDDPAKYIMSEQEAMMKMMSGMVPPPGGGMPGGGAAPGAPQKPGEGDGAGAPPQGVKGPPSPQSIPNRPQV